MGEMADWAYDQAMLEQCRVDEKYLHLNRLSVNELMKLAESFCEPGGEEFSPSEDELSILPSIVQFWKSSGFVTQRQIKAVKSIISELRDFD